MDWIVYFILGWIVGIAWGYVFVLHFKKSDGTIRIEETNDGSTKISMRLSISDEEMETKSRIILDSDFGSR